MDDVFWKFVRAMLIIMSLFGAGALIVILSGETGIGLKMITAFGSMFAGMLGLGSGYILGRVERQHNGKEDPNGRS